MIKNLINKEGVTIENIIRESYKRQSYMGGVINKDKYDVSESPKISKFIDLIDNKNDNKQNLI